MSTNLYLTQNSLVDACVRGTTVNSFQILTRYTACRASKTNAHLPSVDGRRRAARLGCYFDANRVSKTNDQYITPPSFFVNIPAWDTITVVCSLLIDVTSPCRGTKFGQIQRKINVTLRRPMRAWWPNADLDVNVSFRCCLSPSLCQICRRDHTHTLISTALKDPCLGQT